MGCAEVLKMDCDCAGREAVTGSGRRFSRSSAYTNKLRQTPENVYHSSIISPREATVCTRCQVDRKGTRRKKF